MTNTQKVLLLLLLAASSVIGGTLVQLETWGPLATPKFWGVLLGQLLMVEMPLLAAYRLLPDDALDKVDPKRFAKGAGIGAALLLALFLPTAAHAQTLGIHAMTSDVVTAMQASEPAGDALFTDKVVVWSRGIFIGSGVAHCALAGIAGAKADTGAVFQDVMVCASSTAATIVAAELLPKNWQKVFAYVGVGLTQAIVDGRKIVKDIQARK